MWNAWTAPPGALPQDYDTWSCEAHCVRCGELAQDCHCDEHEMRRNHERLRPDWSQCCLNCGASPIVPATGLCGPCTFGEADTSGGQWWDEDDEITSEDTHDIDDRTR
jgi:hypothetical protein